MPLTMLDLSSAAMNRFEPCRCSPEVAHDFRGILLAEPPPIPASAGGPFPVIATYRVSARFASQFRSLHNEIIVVVVDARTHRPRITGLLRPDSKPRESSFDSKAPGFDKMAMTGWFNLDLYTWMDDFPRAPGRYWVYAAAGDMVSNVVSVEIVA
jgi:hypothetical protein